VGFPRSGGRVLGVHHSGSFHRPARENREYSIHGQTNTQATRRRQIVAMVRRGASLRAAARRARVSLDTVQRWIARAVGQRLDRVEWTDRPPIAHTIHRTAPRIERMILTARRALQEQSDLGEFGAHAIHRALLARALPAVPSVRTIGRILERRGALDGRRRVRRVPPPRGWYLPAVASGGRELDSFDVVEGLQLPDGTEVEVLTGTSLHGGLVGAWPGPPLTARHIVTTLITHWRDVGMPAYAQFDNDNRFQGPHQHADTMGRVIRLCLSLAIVPVFAPPREPGFQNGVENLNGRWQEKVWGRFDHRSLTGLCVRSTRYVAASRQRAVVRHERTPPRTLFPAGWQLDLQAPLHGRVIFIRRTTEYGAVSLLGHTLRVDPHWCHRLVRCEVLLDHQCIRFYGLRRAHPDLQPLLGEARYRLPERRFKE